MTKLKQAVSNVHHDVEVITDHLVSLSYDLEDADSLVAGEIRSEALRISALVRELTKVKEAPVKPVKKGKAR